MIRKYNKCIPLLVILVALVSCDVDNGHTIKSPNGQVSATFSVKDGSLFYTVSKDGLSIVDSSQVEIFSGATMVVTDQSIRENDTSWNPVWGQFSTIRDNHREMSLSMTADDIPVKLLCRVFDKGVGFRFVMSQESKCKEITFNSNCNIVGNVRYYTPEGEKGVLGPANLNELENIQIPLMIENLDGGAAALMESDLFSATGFEEVVIQYNAETNGAISTSTATSTGGDHVTPWRVLLLGEELGDFLENKVVLNLAAPCQIEDVSWIKPGKGLWDWRFRGYDNGKFKYRLDEQSLLHLIDFASDQGFEWLNIDAGWSKRQADLEKVFVYAREKDIKLMLYYDVRNSVFIERDKLFAHYAELGAAGIKHGIIRNDAELTRYAIKEAAKNKLLINFHDRPVGMAGAERTMPNLITYEYCHAQQDARRAFTPETFIKMAMANSLVAPLDQANGNFGINSINAGERNTGPRIRDSYIATVVSEAARTMVSYSGLISLPDAPEEYLKKADLFEYLKVMPATWDDTRVIQSKMGEYISMARCTGDDWFVGTVNNQQERTLQLTLDFLEPEISYEATIYKDAADAHGVNNPEVYEIETMTVKKDDVVPAKMAFGGGHAMILRPL